MEKYNYLESMKNDIIDYLNENYDATNELWDKDRDEFAEELNETLWVEDSVTGNASGSYTCNAWKADEFLAHNRELLIEALEEFGDSLESYRKAIESSEYADVTIRCYLLPQAIELALDEWWQGNE